MTCGPIARTSKSADCNEPTGEAVAEVGGEVDSTAAAEACLPVSASPVVAYLASGKDMVFFTRYGSLSEISHPLQLIRISAQYKNNNNNIIDIDIDKHIHVTIDTAKDIDIDM